MAEILHLHSGLQLGGGFCDRSSIKHWDFQSQQLIRKTLLKTLKRSFISMVPINSGKLWISSLFCIREIDGSFKWEINTERGLILTRVWGSYQRMSLYFPVAQRSILHLLFNLLWSQFCLAICSLCWQIHVVVFHFWSLQKPSFLPSSWVQRFDQWILGPIFFFFF